MLSRELNNQGIYPPVHISPSLSRLMKDGIGKDDTREDHPHIAAQLYALYARALETRNLASIIGADELSERDRRYLTFADDFGKRFVAQDEAVVVSVRASTCLAASRIASDTASPASSSSSTIKEPLPTASCLAPSLPRASS